MEAAEIAGREQANKVKITGLENWKKSCLIVGLPSKFRFRKKSSDRLGMVFVIPRKKVLLFAEIRVSRNSPFRASERKTKRNGILRKMRFDGTANIVCDVAQ
jgi:hypothetical protein